jgi:hypothetical protein
MTSTNASAACSARQDVGKKIGLISCQILIAACFIFIAGCDGKTDGHTTKNENVPTDTPAKPKVNIKVNRHYDEQGNVVGFDSTYTSFYSNISGDTVAMDTLMEGFDKYFNFHYPSIFQREFSPLFFTDSLRYPDFFHEDFFMKRYELNDPYMRDMMQRMDSIKNQYFEERSKPPKEGKTL